MGVFGKLFGRRGMLTDEVRARMTADGLLLVEEGASGTVTYRNYRAPGRRSSLEKVGMVWALAASGRGLLVASGGRPMIDVAWSDPRSAALIPSIDANGKLLITFDPHAFDDRTSGTIEVRAHSSHGPAWVALIESHQHH